MTDRQIKRFNQRATEELLRTGKAQPFILGRKPSGPPLEINYDDFEGFAFGVRYAS